MATPDTDGTTTSAASWCSRLFALCRRGHAQQPLTPAERAVLKFLTSAAIYSLVSVLLLVGQIILAHGALISLPECALVLLIVFLGSTASALAKYASAHGDAQVGAALALLTDEGVRAACLAGGIDPALANAIADAVRGALAAPTSPTTSGPENPFADPMDPLDPLDPLDHIDRFGQ